MEKAMEKGVPNKLKIPWMTASVVDHVPREETSLLNHLCSLDARRTGVAMPERQTRVFCTVGPSCRDVKILEQMIEAGMTLARINFSHGSYDDHLTLINNIRVACANHNARLGFNHTVAIAADLKGPEIRTGVLDSKAEAVELVTGGEITLTSDWNFETKTNANLIYIDYSQIEYVLKLLDELIIDNGELVLSVKQINIFEKTVVCKIKKGGTLRSDRSVLVPGVPLEFPVVTPSDIAAIKFAIDEQLDFVMVSLLRDADTIREIQELPFMDDPMYRARFGDHGPSIKVIAKIENEQALSQIDEIISAADGVVICRRSLSLEMAPEKMFLAQKAIIAKCHKQGKAVICSQQLLDSMATQVDASRSEVIDLANCVTDGCDALMMTRETSSSPHPVACVRVAARICQQAETALWTQQLFTELKQMQPAPTDAAHAIAMCVVDTSKQCRAAAIVVVTTSGRSARLVSRYRPKCPVVAVTRFGHVARQLITCRNVMPLLYAKKSHCDWLKDVDLRVSYGLEYGRRLGFVKGGDCVILVSGWRQGAGFTNTLRIIYVHATEAEYLAPITV